MNTAIRWRIISLQSAMVIVLAAAAGFAFYEGNFVTNTVRTELTAQQISFPPASEIKAGGALDPAEFPQEIRDQAGKQVTTGDQAKIYANDFIGKHLAGVAGGLTYSQMSTLSAPVQAQLATTPKTDPQYAVLQAKLATIAGQKDTLLNGEMLRATLLNSWGWWTMGTDVAYAGIGLLIAALGMLSALVFELFIAARKTETFKVTPKVAVAPRISAPA
ncbi:MAG TPA: hypothetical protein VGG90_00595 [Candidatus Dormibacteraeota bacterium]